MKTQEYVQPKLRIPTDCDNCTACVQPCGECDQGTEMTKIRQVNPSIVENPIQVAGRNIRARFTLSKIEGGSLASS